MTQNKEWLRWLNSALLTLNLSVLGYLVSKQDRLERKVEGLLESSRSYSDSRIREHVEMSRENVTELIVHRQQIGDLQKRVGIIETQVDNIRRRS